MKRLIIWAAALAMAFEALAAIPFGNVRTTPRRTVRLMAASNGADAGFDCFIGCTGEPIQGLGVKVSAGTEISFDFDCTEEFKPLSWTLNGVEKPLPTVNPDGRSMTFSFDCQANDTIVYIVCRRPIYVDAAAGQDVTNPSNEVSRGYSPDRPFKSIQFGADIALADAEVRVAGGTYAPFSLTNSHVRIVHTNLADRAVIDADGKSRCAEFLVCYSNGTERVVESSATNGLLRGFTLRNGRADVGLGGREAGAGGGVRGGLIVNCEVTACTADADGGGIYAALVRSSLIHGCSARVGGGAALSSLVNCTVAANTATETGGGLDHSCATNSVISANSVNGNPNDLDAASRTRYSVSGKVTFTSLSDFHLKRPSGALTEGLAKVLRADETDLDGKPYHVPGQTAGKLLLGCYQTAEELHVPDTGLRINGLPFGDPECPIADWHPATSTVVLFEGEFTVSGTATNACTLAGVDKLKTRVRFEPVASGFAISNLTVVGGTASVTAMNSVEVPGGNVSPQVGGDVSGITGWDKPLHEVRFTAEGWNPGGEFVLTGLHDYDTTGLVPADNGTVSLWLPAVRKWTCLTYGAADDLHRLCYRMAADGSVTVIRESDLGTFAINGETVFDALMTPNPVWTYDAVGNRVSISMSGNYVCTGECTSGLGLNLDANAKVTLSNVVLDCTSAYGRSAIELGEHVTATLLLDGTNTLHGAGPRGCGVFVPTGTSLTVTNAASAETAVLNAKGEAFGAGLGSGVSDGCGRIAIRGGTVNATGGVAAPGIGICDCNNGFFERIEISGGFVRARSGAVDYGTTSSPAIGCGSMGTGGEILISGGFVDVAEGADAAPIGWGKVRNGGQMRVVISGGTVAAGGSGKMICGPLQDDKEANSTYIITGGSVFADAVSVHPAPSNGGAAVRRVMARIPEDWPAEAAVEVVGLPDYGTHDIRAIGGRVYLWLPEGAGRLSLVCREPGDSSGKTAYYGFASTGACEAQSIPEPLPRGLTVNGLDIVWGRGRGWALTEDGEELDLFGPGPYTLSGSATNVSVVVQSNATVALSGVVLDCRSAFGPSAIELGERVTATLLIDGTNTLYGGGSSGCGVLVPEGSSLTVTNAAQAETAVLNAEGGGPGLGAGDRWCGSIAIRGGTVNATGGTGASGIGTGLYGGSFERIEISGGFVRARSSGDASSAIGCASYGFGGEILISGGYVDVAAGTDAAPIGWGLERRAGGGGRMRVVISGGTVAAGGSEMMICGPLRDEKERDSTYLITGGSVFADAVSVHPAPSNGGAAVRRVMVRIPEDWPAEAAVEVRGLADYGTRDVRAIGGRVYLWLPEGAGNLSLVCREPGDSSGKTASYSFASTGACEAQPFIGGLAVNGLDITQKSGRGWALTEDGEELDLFGPGPYTLSGSATNVSVVVQSNATVTLSGVVLDCRSAFGPSAIVLGERVTATLLLSGENTLHGGNSGSCGVLVPEGSSLTVTNAAQAETAVLNAEGGGPGLGAGDRSCGSIAIRGGTVNATGGFSAPGIGVGDGDGFFERIEISGGFVRARSSGDASSAIGCASYGFGGEILISGGYVDVAAGTDAAPIGWGLERKAGGEGRMRVVISGGTVAAGGSEMMICGPLQDYKERDSTYIITGGSVFADAVSVHPVPSNGDAAVRRVAVTLPEDWPVESAVEVVGLPDYGTRDVRAIGGRVYLWLPEGAGKLSLVCREPGDSSGMVASYSFASTGACEAQPLTVELTVNGLAITRKSGPGWALTEAGDELDLFGPGPFVLAGESTDRLHVCVNADAEVTLSNLTLSVGGEWESAFTIASDVSAKVFLFGTNRLESTKRSTSEYHGGGAGIRVPKTATVSISNAPGVPDDAAVLYVNGGDAAAAIGETSRDRQRWDCGTVWIRGGTVFAVGGTYSAAIGSAYFGACGRIVISGGRVDARTRSNNNASAIGCGENGYGGSVEVFGGRIVAKGAYLASPIGWGEYRIMNETDVVSEMEVLISGGTIDVSESESGMVWPRGGGGDGEAHSKFTITGGSLRFLKTARPQPTDGYDPVRRVEVDVRGIAEDGEQVTIEGLEGYGLKDVVPIDGKLYLWLPDGWHPFTCNGVPLAVFVSGDRILADRPENLAGSGLTVNGQRLTDPHAAPWGFDGTNLCLKGAGRFVISGSATNVRVVAMADCSVVMSNLVLTVPNRTADNWYWSAFAVSNAANVDLTFEGTDNLLAVRDYPDAGPTPGAGVLVARDSTLRILNGTAMFSSVRGYCGPGRDDFGRLDILGGSLDLEDGGLLEIVPSNGVSRVRRVTIPLPPGTPADEPVVLTGFGDYGVRDLYPSANDTLNVWLPEREYVVGVAGRYYRIAEANDCIAEPIVTGFTVNGRECTFGSGPGWRYSADYEELSLDCTTDYTLSCTNLGYGLDIVIAQDKAAMIVGGTLDWDRPIDGALRICGGNMRLAPSAFTVPPSNGAGERVYPVTVNLTDGFSDDVALELSEMTRDGAAYGYGCEDTRPIDGTLTIWLPRGGYRFAVNGIPYAVTVEGRAAAAEPLGIGLRVDNLYDVSEPNHPAGWTWNGYTRTLDMTERHRLDGTNPVVAVTLASGTVNGGTARISAARPGVRITGGSMKIGNAASVALSNDYARVHCVPVPVPYGVRDGDEVRISGGVPYGSDGIVAMDGHVYLWLPGVTNVFVVNGIPMISTVTDGKTEVSYFEMGLTVDGVDVGRGVGNGWTWDAATGELTITGKDGGAPYLLSGGETLESTHMQVTADARLVMSNFLLNASMGERSALTVAKGCTATLSFPGPSRLFGAAGRSALGGEGRVVIEGGTAFLSGDADGEAVSECAWEINGGSIGIGPLDTLPVRPVNAASQEVVLVEVELPGRKTQGDSLVFDPGNLPGYYNLKDIRPSATGDVSLWLPRTQPTNVYEFAIDGDRYRAVLTGEGSSVTPLYDRIGVSVNGIDCGLLHDAGWTYDPVTGVLALDGGVKNYVVTGSNETGLVRIRAAATAAGGWINLVASDLVLTTVSDGESPVDVVPGTVLVISVDGEARFAAASGAAGIHVPPGAALNATYLLLGARTISDVLVASGGALAAGIGGNAGEGAGSVIVDGVNVEAHGGVRAAAIGGGSRGAGGDVEIRCGEILAYGGDGRDGDGLGGAGIGGGYLGAGGRTVVSGGFCEIFAGENGAAIGGGAGGDGGIVDIRGGTVFPHLRHPEPFAQDAAAIGGGSGGQAGSNAFAGGSVVVTNALGETAADLVRDAPTSALGAAVAGIVLAVPPESAISDHTPVTIVGLGDYGVNDIYPVGGKLYLWLPDNAEGEHYIFTVDDVGYDLVVRNGKAEYLEYLVSGVTVNGVDCCFTNNPAWLWTPANSNLTVSGGGTYVVSGEAWRDNVRVVAAGGSTVVLSNFVASAAFDEPVAVAAGQEATFVFAGSNDCFRALGGAGRATVERGNVVLGAIGGTIAKVVVAGGNVICEDEKSCERDCMANPDGRRVWPVTVDLPAGCTNALPVAFEGLPPYYDATGIRDIGGRVCVWLPEGQWDLSVIGTALAGDGTETNLVTNLTAVVTDEGAIIGELASVSVPDDEGGTVEVPVPWVIAHMRPAATPSISAMRNYLNGPSRNDGIPVWQSYVAGLDPNDPAQTFKAVIECRDGCFVVRPSLVVPDRIYWVIASPDLSFDPNRIVVYPLPASGKVEFPADRVNMFFKVKVGFE